MCKLLLRSILILGNGLIHVLKTRIDYCKETGLRARNFCEVCHSFVVANIPRRELVIVEWLI